ncbi:MAG: chorismate-binding protein, partial [Janthinobacterium lividum]
MTICRFEDAINKQALALYGLRRRIEARSPAELPLAMDAIAASQREGHWIALMLPYSLGEWLEPGLRTERAAEDGESRLSALVFERCEIEPIWGAPAPDQQCEIISVRPQVDFAEYSERLAQIRHWIEAGEVYQINYTFPLDVQIDGSTEALYRTLINRHPAGHAAYISDQGRHVLSFSPELFLS